MSAVDITKHYASHCDKSLVDFGEGQFSGAEVSTQIPCSFNKVTGIWITPMDEPNSVERYYFDGVNDGGTTTIFRKNDERIASFAIDNAQIVDANLPWTPLIIAQRGMVLTQVEWFHGTPWNIGSAQPAFSLGTYTDQGAYINASAIGSWTTANSTATFTTFVTDDVDDGTVIGAKTTLGTGYSGTASPSSSVSFTPSVTVSATPSPSVTVSATPSVTVSATPSPSVTVSSTPSPSVTVSSTPSPSVTVSATPSPTVSATPSASAGQVASATPSVTVSGTPSNTVSATGTPSNTVSATGTPSNTVSATKTPSNTVSATPSNTVSATRTPSNTVSATPSSSVSPSVTPSPTAASTDVPGDIIITVAYCTPQSSMRFKYTIFGLY